MDGYARAHRLASRILSLTTKKIEISGLENILEGPGILTPNHPDWREILVLGTKLKRKVVFAARKEVFEAKEFSKLMNSYLKRKIGAFAYALYPITGLASAYMSSLVRESGAAYPICRENGNGFLDHGKEHLDRGDLLCVFPEGTITDAKSKIVNHFKHGVSLMCYKLNQAGLNVPVYPVSIRGMERYFRDVVVHVDKPYYIKDYANGSKRNTLEAFTNLLENRVMSLYSDVPMTQPVSEV
jgi:1-acyl-sn-glycerol-3-phosphate acyltransferase